MKLAHIAIAVEKLEAVVPAWEKAFQVKASEVEFVPDQKVRLRFLEIGGVRLEFLEPTSEDSPIQNFLKKRGNGLHHLAFQVNDIHGRLSHLKSVSVPLIDESPRPGAEHCEVAFLHPKGLGGVLVELTEPQNG